MREILFVAGETSGDLHAASVVHELMARGANYRIRGVGGDLMRAAGADLDQHIREMAVLGLIEVVRHIPRHWKLLRVLGDRIRSGKVALVVLVDYPGFNMRVAEIAARAGVPVLYYIVPQVWAWGADRLDKIARRVTKAAVILPFEEALLRSHGTDATFVGHPLLDRIAGLPARDQARAQLGIDRNVPLLALFPGSREQEIARHLDVFVRAAEIVRSRCTGLEVVVAAAPHVEIDERNCPFRVVRSASMPLLRAADAAICKSGTTTLEAAVAGCPLVVAYRTHPLTYFAARRLVKIPNIGLVNVVAGHQVAPEFIQDALQPAAVADKVLPLLSSDSPERQRMVTDLAGVRRQLGEPGAARRVADIVQRLAGGAPA